MKIESDYFKTNSDKGWFHNKDIRGVVLAPPQDDPYFIKVSEQMSRSGKIVPLFKSTCFVHTRLAQDQFL